MKKITLPLLVLLLISSAFSQWSQISTVNTTQLNAVKFFNEWTGITAGIGGIWRSTNSGINWTQVLAGVNMNAVYFKDNSTGFAVGDSGKIYNSYNNGLNWEQQGIGVTVNNLYGVTFSNFNTWHICGSGIILRTFNGGSTWGSQIYSNQDLYSIIMNNNSEGYVIGSSSSEIVKNTANGGTDWYTVLNLNGYSCYDISSVGSLSKIIVVGNYGRIRRSMNWGLNWTFPQSNFNSNLNAVTFPNGNVGYICGNNGFITRSLDSGLSWITQASGVSNNLKDMSFINEQTGWIVGQNGIVLRTGIPVKIDPINSELPKEFKLYQNYPNPFNPSTNIVFSIPVAGYIQIKIFDVLGICIKELYSGYMLPGKYLAKFYGSNLASGIYFYNLETPFFKDTKRMLFVK